MERGLPEGPLHAAPGGPGVRGLAGRSRKGPAAPLHADTIKGKRQPTARDPLACITVRLGQSQRLTRPEHVQGLFGTFLLRM